MRGHVIVMRRFSGFLPPKGGAANISDCCKFPVN
jgi:hypothetical protein